MGLQYRPGHCLKLRLGETDAGQERFLFAAYNPVSIYQIDSLIFFSHHKFHLVIYVFSNRP